MKFCEHLVSYQPSNPGEEILQAETFRQFNAIVQAPRARLASVTTGIPHTMWRGVAVGAVLNTVLFGFPG